MRPATALLINALAVVTACGDGTVGPGIDPRAISLAVGEVRTISSSDAAPLLIRAGTGGAEFTLVPLYAVLPGSAPIALQFSGDQLTEPTGPPMPQVRAPAAGLSRTGVDAVFAPDAGGFQARLRQIEREVFAPRIPGAREEYLRLTALRSVASDVPEVGEQMVLNTSVTSPCSDPRLRTGRVVAVTQHAVIVADEANPAGGFTDAEYAEIGEGFDALVYPVITENFGTPSDIDANGGRSVIFFTSAVNELTPAGAGYLISGFFFVRDLFPKSGSGGCAGSNQAEMLYTLVPDPNGDVNGNIHTKAFVRRFALANLAHNSQYIVNASRRMFVNNVNSLEEPWLAAGLSQIAEELVFYRASQLAPRQNITQEMLLSSQTIEDALNAYQDQNLFRLTLYLQEPESHSPYAASDNLATRGATWQFLRYAADRSTTAEQALWFKLVNSRTIGIENVAASTGSDFFTLLREWATAQYTDDAGFDVAGAFRHPSWNFRSVLPPRRQDGSFPLSTRVLPTGSPVSLNLSAGGAAYLRFGVAAGRVGSVRLTPAGETGAGGGSAFADVLLTLVRTK